MRELIGGLAALAILFQVIVMTRAGEDQGALSVQDLANGQTASALVSCLLAITSGVPHLPSVFA